MSAEINLSKEIFECDDEYHPKEKVILASKVKEFIEKVRDLVSLNDLDEFDKLAGDNLK